MSKANSLLTLVIGTGLGLAAAAALSTVGQPNIGGKSVSSAMATDREALVGMQGARIVDPEDQQAREELLAALDSRRVVLVGESHDRYDHHLNQLAVIRGLHERGADLAVGVEFFQEPFQPSLDAFIAGRIDEKALLKETEYFERWRFDYRLYRDIVTYARDKGIPLVALNAPTELVKEVSTKGIRGLSTEDRARLPLDMRPASTAYEARLRPIFAMHGKTSEERFQRFQDVQLLWDEHMARVARDYLAANPAKKLVVLAGSGHVAYPDAIPDRLQRMINGEITTIATGSPERFADGQVDYLFVDRDIALGPPERSGLELARVDSGASTPEILPASGERIER